MDQAEIGSLWIGGELSWIERASIHSFVKTGHSYVLYAYDDIVDPPAGIEIRDAREVWDVDRIIFHKKANSPAIHADVFRAMMVQQTGRVWADTDIIALRPFPADLKWYIGHERTDKVELGNAIMGLPPESQTLSDLLAFLTDDFPIPPWLNPGPRKALQQRKLLGQPLDLGELAWGSTGPKALTYFAKKAGEIENAQPQPVFFPVSFQKRKHLTDPQLGVDVAAYIEEHDSLCVHLYSRWLRKFTKGMFGQRPRKTSWLGGYLDAEGLVDYETLDAARERKKKRQVGSKPLPAMDKEAFYKDLEKRREALPVEKNTSPYGRVSAVTMAKDEGPYILEWVAHHHVLGFTDILIYTNDCTDGTTEMLDALHDIGIVSHYDNPELGTKPPQSRALTRANQHALVKYADWVMVFDLDEFVAIRHGDGTINSILDVIRQKGATGMALTWRFFGCSGQKRYDSTPVTERFQQGATDNFHNGYGVKTIFKQDDRLRLAIHRPRIKKRNKNADAAPMDLNWVNGSGNPIDGKVMTWRQTRKSKGYELAQVNHYGVKSHEEYLMRRLRGDVLNNHGKYDAKYFRKFDRNELHDETAMRFSRERDALIEKLRQFETVRSAEKIIHERHQAKLNKLRDADNYNDLMKDLVSQGES